MQTTKAPDAVMVTDGTTQQATQPTSQDAVISVDAHLWGYLIPCNPRQSRIDLYRSQPAYRFGRNTSPDCGNQVILPGMKISNQHCDIEWDGSSDRSAVVKVTDRSSNGTFINGEKIGKWRYGLLQEGNEIAFGTAVPQPPERAAEDYRYIFRHLAAGPATEGLYAHYSLVAELGKGSFATVMKALCKENGREYAVKMIQANKLKAAVQHAPNGNGGGKLVASEQFAREITIMEKLRHKNICQLKEVFFEEGNINLVLELVSGGDLLDYIVARDGLGESESRDITFQVCEAMAYIHSLGVTHRDLKPENILLTKDTPPMVKVADFGLAKAVDSLTMLRTMCGTPTYLAPEVVSQEPGNEGYQQVVDSWSVGVIVFSMITNASPFQEPSNTDVKMRILNRRIEWSILKERNISNECQQFIIALLQIRPQVRMTLTDALSHSWMAPLADQSEFSKSHLAPPSDPAPLDRDMSMQSVAEPMDMDEDPDMSQSQSQDGHVPGAFPSRSLRRRRDIIDDANENGEELPQPSQEMIEHEAAYYTRGTSRANKRKASPLTYESSLTPMPEDNGRGRSEDMSIEEEETAAAQKKQRKGKAASQPPDSQASDGTRARKGRGGKTAPKTGHRMRTRGQAPGNSSESDDGLPADAKPRRSTRISQSPQKSGRR